MEDVAKVREQALKAAGVRILFVGCGEPSYIKSYRGTYPNVCEDHLR